MRRRPVGSWVAPLMAATLFGATGSSPSGVVEKTRLALRVLQLRHPEVVWRGPELQAELTDDGITDLAVVGTDPETLVVALIVGPVDGDSRLVRVGWRVGGSEGLDPTCARAATLTLEELDFARELDAAGALEAEAARGRGVKGLCLGAPPCDVFHLYWDKAARSLSWWRLDRRSSNEGPLRSGGCGR